MNLKQKYGNTALVAGASEGLGAAFSTYLAAQGLDVVLVARRKEPLEKLGRELEHKYHIQATCIATDLAEATATIEIQKQLSGKEINLLVYNAGLSYIGAFETNPVEQNNYIAQLNMLSCMNMVQAFGEQMLQRGRGAVISMSSLAGMQGSGFLSVYAATKAFNRVFAESLWYEWKNRGVDVMACIAGATSTPNFINTKPEPMGFFAPKIQTPEEVVEECFAYLGKGPSHITGTGNRWASFFMQNLLPRKMAINIMGDNTRRIYRL